MTATERLRQLLDERGVEWLPDHKDKDKDKDGVAVTTTRWRDNEGRLVAINIIEPYGDTWNFFWYPTPEQAVDATLGRGTCKFEYTLADNGWADHTCSECGYVENLDVHVGLGWHYCPNCGREIVE